MKLKYFSNHIYSNTAKKNQRYEYHGFLSMLAVCTILRSKSILWTYFIQLQFMKGKNGSTFEDSFQDSMTFKSRAIRSQSERWHIRIFYFFYCETPCDLTHISAHLWYKNGGPTFWHLQRHPFISHFHAIYSQRLKIKLWIGQFKNCSFLTKTKSFHCRLISYFYSSVQSYLINYK